jgi:predicted transcriptional regulator
MTTDRVGQHRLLLGKLAHAKDTLLTTSGIAPSKPTKAHQAVGLPDKAAIVAAVGELVAEGWVAEANPGKRNASYTLTDAGAAHLASLPPPATPERKSRAKAPREPKPPKPPKPEKIVPDVPENPNLLPHQQAFVLAQLLSADGRTMTEGQANKLPKVAKEDLELNGPLASQIRRKLTDRGYVRTVKEGRSLHVTLTDAGLAHLVSLPHHPAGVFAVTGAALNDLVAAARAAPAAGRAAAATGPASGDEGDGDTAVPTSAPPADLGAAAYAAFRELARERFSRNGLVPIFEIRRELARKHGPAAARHDALDGPILALWRDGKVRLVSISDTRGATAAELDESITDAYETLFYMEDADGHPGTR